jgi:NADH-quinone oxidoreductase subunit N
MIWLAVVGVIFSAISAYFYLRIIMLMYMHEPKGEFDLVKSPALALAVSVTAVLYIGVMPSDILDFARASIAGLM